MPRSSSALQVGLPLTTDYAHAGSTEIGPSSPRGNPEPVELDLGSPLPVRTLSGEVAASTAATGSTATDSASSRDAGKDDGGGAQQPQHRRQGSQGQPAAQPGGLWRFQEPEAEVGGRYPAQL